MFRDCNLVLHAFAHVQVHEHVHLELKVLILVYFVSLCAEILAQDPRGSIWTGNWTWTLGCTGTWHSNSPVWCHSQVGNLSWLPFYNLTPVHSTRFHVEYTASWQSFRKPPSSSWLSSSGPGSVLSITQNSMQCPLKLWPRVWLLACSTHVQTVQRGWKFHDHFWSLHQTGQCVDSLCIS